MKTGTLLNDRYRLTEVLGRGGMAAVYRAEDALLGRAVAVKVFLYVPAVGSERRRIDTEMRTLASLKHPALVTVHDAGVSTDGTPYLVMELVEGATLADRIAAAPLSAPEVAAVARDIAAALEYVHGTGIVHRDVKPANILMGQPGAKLADFGIAQDGQRQAITQVGMTIGTANYLSPEQVRGERITPASDIYSMGLVLIECFTGRRVYEGTGIEAAAARLQHRPEVPMAVPPAWSDLLTAMTETDPRRRPTAAEVLQRIPAVDGGTAVTAVLGPAPRRSDTSLLPAGALGGRRKPRPLLWLSGAAAILVLLFGGATLAAMDRGGDAPPTGPQPTYPAVPGPLGEHLKQLQEAVR